MAPEDINGARKISLMEVDKYLEYYPVEDVYYFIEVVFEIDRLVKAYGINTDSKN